MRDSELIFAEQFAAEIHRLGEIINKPGQADIESLNNLSSVLSCLLNLGERCPDTWSETEIEAPEIDRKKIAEVISNRFPKFGFYNSSTPECVPIDSVIVDVNDASDDVYDIYCDLNKSLWYFENDEPALFYGRLNSCSATGVVMRSI